MVGGEPTWAEVVLLALNVAQTVALAWISSRSTRVRASDSSGAPKGQHEAS